jgi:5-methylcytosine-specific restriction endonuclease McrA
MHDNQESHRVIDRLSDYSDEALRSELRRIAHSLGRTSLTIEDIEKHGRCSYGLLKQRFGGLRRALRFADLSPNDFHRNVPDDELLGELCRIWDLVLKEGRRRPRKEDLARLKSKFSHGPYYRRWRSWIKACEAVLAWEANTPEQLTEQGTKFPELIRSTPRRKRPIPLRIRYAILLRDNWICQICGRKSGNGVEVDVDHIKSERDGGTLDPSNLRCLCKDCNIGKGSYSESASYS